MSLGGLVGAFVALVVVILVNSWYVSSTGHGLSTSANVLLLVAAWLASLAPKYLRAIDKRIGVADARTDTDITDDSGSAREVSSAGGHPERIARVDAYWLTKRFRLGRPVVTPLGASASTLTLCVDVAFDVTEGGEIRVHSVDLTRGGSLGSCAVNATTTRGEAFFLDKPVDREALRAAVLEELEAPKSGLRRIMAARWRDRRR